ncbi:hypothetical protein O181_058453 [Austropuccinia psidii MF-1]|uniref:Uncharacterized protein n=1 Tax=Austropuccinia psidii MF-1 TaxID=1389203 RepID=A0A9Q3HVI8_9BASI|nr:hypothetical protein [Austropuccinia psidii MF-1]
MKDGDGKRTFELGPIITHGIQTPKTKPTKSPIPSLPHEQTLRQPTPCLSGTQWLEDLFRKPSQTDEPPIPGLSLSSEPHEHVPACEPEPEVALTQSMEEPFAPPTPPPSVIIIDDMPVRSPSIHSYPGSFPGDPSHCPQEPNRLLPLIATMRLSRNSLTCDQH